MLLLTLCKAVEIASPLGSSSQWGRGCLLVQKFRLGCSPQGEEQVTTPHLYSNSPATL